MRDSVGVVLGANIGTTSTAWLVSMRLTDIGPFFIVLGTVVRALPTRIQMLGKAGFYFGFIFFGLDLLSSTLKPLAETPVFENFVRRVDLPLTGVLVGVVLTALVQSSTIVTGLCIVMVQQDILTAHAAIPIVIGTKHRHHFEGAVNHNRNEGGCTPRRHRQHLLQCHRRIADSAFLSAFAAAMAIFRITLASASPGPSSCSISG